MVKIIRNKKKPTVIVTPEQKAMLAKLYRLRSKLIRINDAIYYNELYNSYDLVENQKALRNKLRRQVRKLESMIVN